MAYAQSRYTANGTSDTFTIGFSYRNEADVVVKVDGVTKTKTTDYTFPTASQIQFVSTPTNGQAVFITRSTSQDTRLVDYAAGSVFKESDLDTDSEQGFFMAQEAIDIANDSITLDANNRFDATNKRIINVTDPTSAQDAATKNYVDTSATSQVNQAQTARTAAEAAQTAAETAQAAAETAETNAETAQTAAETAKTGAETAKTGAETAKTGAETAKTAAETAQTAAENAETNAETAETNAETAETNASGFADEAENWAQKITGEAVTGEGYSSKAWATGGTGVTDTAGSGASKEWAVETTSTVDGTEYSAKEYAIGTQRRGQSGGGSAKDWATYTAGTVDGTTYSAKYYAEQAAANFDNFDDRYLGAKSSAPTVDNDGNALVNGALYYDSANSKLNVYDTGTSQWSAIEAGATAGFAIAMSIAL